MLALRCVKIHKEYKLTGRLPAIWPGMPICIRKGDAVAAGLSQGLSQRALDLAVTCGW